MAVTMATVELIRMAIYLGGYIYLSVSQLIEIAQGKPIPDEQLTRLKELNTSQDVRAKAFLPGAEEDAIPFESVEIAAIVKAEKKTLVNEFVTLVKADFIRESAVDL